MPLIEATWTPAEAGAGSHTAGTPPSEPLPGHPLAPRLASQRTDLPLDYDVVVIGSGAGGAPLALRLQRAGLRVALLEQGGLALPTTPFLALERSYARQGMVVSIRRGILPVFAGCALGGTTAINSGTTLRPIRPWISAWDEAFGADALGLLEPFLEEAERLLRVETPPRSLLGPSAALFEEGLSSLGLGGARVLRRNAPGCRGAGSCCFGCPAFAKKGTDLAFLPEALDDGLALWARTRAEQVIEGPGALRVAVRRLGRSLTLRTRHVVLAAGALFTPGLIARGRLGERWREAGRHLKIHPAAKVTAFFEAPVHGGRGVPQGLGWQPPDPALERLVMEGVFTPPEALAPILPLPGRRARWWLERHEHLASMGMMVRDRGHGRVLSLLGRPFPDYALHPEDGLDLARGILRCAEVWFAAGARRVVLPVVGVPNEIDSLASLRAIQAQTLRPGNLYASGFHPQGTAGVGRVVDADLRLTPRVSVCDASVLPDTPGVNPQLVIMALSLRLAARLEGELR
jgi:choline dehydrogenase-like flavoprotein